MLRGSITQVNICRINTFLDNVDVGEYYVHGDLEAYSCMIMLSPALYVHKKVFIATPVS